MEFKMSDEMKRALNVKNKEKKDNVTSGKMIIDMSADNLHEHDRDNNVSFRLSDNFFEKKNDNKEERLAKEVMEYVKEHTIIEEDDSDTEEEMVTYKEFLWLVRNGYIITYGKVMYPDYNKIKIRYKIDNKKKKK